MKDKDFYNNLLKELKVREIASDGELEDARVLRKKTWDRQSWQKKHNQNHAEAESLYLLVCGRILSYTGDTRGRTVASHTAEAAATLQRCQHGLSEVSTAVQRMAELHSAAVHELSKDGAPQE